MVTLRFSVLQLCSATLLNAGAVGGGGCGGGGWGGAMIWISSSLEISPSGFRTRTFLAPGFATNADGIVPRSSVFDTKSVLIQLLPWKTITAPARKCAPTHSIAMSLPPAA